MKTILVVTAMVLAPLAGVQARDLAYSDQDGARVCLDFQTPRTKHGNIVHRTASTGTMPCLGYLGTTISRPNRQPTPT
jgi:hypothetical protein